MPTTFANGADFKGAKLINLGSPTADTDATTKAYVDAAIRGLDWKPSVRVASSSNVTVASPGTTIDGVAMATGDSFALLGQTTGSENGIYVWNGAAVAATRRTDADANAEVTAGLAFSVSEGTTNGDKLFVLITNDPIVIGTTALQFTQVGSASAPYTAGNGLTLIGQQFSVVAKTNGGIIVDGTGVSVDFSVLVRDFWTNIGDGTQTSISITHNFGTLDFGVILVETATGKEWLADITSRTTNTVVLAFNTAPTTNQFRVGILA